MASFSSSSNKYDVFLSFRGENTRDNFTSHLHTALCQKQIETFIDNDLRRGDKISSSLLNAIKQSKIAVVILSEGYASSRWCLQELVEILECKEKYEQIVIPVFYRVDPSDVRNQTGNFGDGFSKLEERFRERVEELQKWRNALREVADVSGFDSGVIRPESVLVERIVKGILKKLNDKFPNELGRDFVGIESSIKEIESLLSYNSIDALTLGIWGIGGIGKTTIARAYFNRYSNCFDGFCFLENIREESGKNGGLALLQQKMFSTLLGEGNLNDCISSFNFARIGRKKVLIVFDDVTDFEQIKSLIGNFDCFGIGSLIFVTTRDKQILKNCGVKIAYEMKELENDNALKLFNRHAFKGDQPKVGYKDLSSTVVKYCYGVPLALEVLGRSLFERSKGVWESSIEKLKRIPHCKIQNVLKLSYDRLDDGDKNIFLDIACFLKDEGKGCAINFLKACGYYAKVGLCNLEDKCLIKLSEHNEIIIHDLLQQMGREIVRQESDDCAKRSRLWHPEEIREILRDNTGTEAIQAISLDMSKVKEIKLNLDIFKKVPNLRFLKFHGDNKFKICDFESGGYIFRMFRFLHRCNFANSGYIFRKLRYLHWEGYPLKELPQNIHAENLVFLELPGSEVEQLWNGVQNLVNLKEIDLMRSKHLTKLPDLSKVQNLEMLDLSYCESLNSFSSIIGSKSLEALFLSGCSNLKRIPEISSYNLQWLDLSGTAIEELPSFIEYQSRLVQLELQNCSQLKNLPSGLCKLKSLEQLTLVGCKNLRTLPDEFGNLEALVDLWICETLIREVPSSILCLNNLHYLSLSGLRGHKKDDFISSFPSSLVGLTCLHLMDCDITELPESLGQLSSLFLLDLSKNNFERIPESIINLSKLQDLHLYNCQRLISIPKLPCRLEYLNARNCASLDSISSFFVSSRSRKVFNFKNCYKLEGDQLRKIFEESLQKIRPTTDNFDLVIVVPGREIPKWFKNRSIGSRITLELPPADHQKLIGFAFCLAFEEDHYDGKNKFHVTDELKVTNSHFGSFYVSRLSYVDSDHILLGYHFFRDMVFDFEGKFSDHNEVCTEFSVTVYKRYYRLKACGIDLLYARNDGESFQDHNTSFNNTDEYGDEEGMRKKKRKREEEEEEEEK